MRNYILEFYADVSSYPCSNCDANLAGWLVKEVAVVHGDFFITTIAFARHILSCFRIAHHK